MKTSELRIGNKVDYYGNIVTINYIDEEHVGFSDYVPVDYPLASELNGIPITPDLIVEFGFNQEYFSDPVYFLKDENHFVVDLFEERVSWDSTFYSGDICDHKLPKYIHQLQNFYYYLTGREL